MWVALYSQTGSEIKNLTEVLGYGPDIILTNNKEKEGWMPHNDLMKEILKYPDALITLHGYLRILPPEVCHLSILNGHPGLITKYPELKGKDPQERITPEMTHIGSVVHRVTEGVDEGEVISEAFVENTGGDYYNILKQTSLEAWKKLL